MLEHRLKHLVLATVGSSANEHFLPMLAVSDPRVQAIYRLAAERTQQQLRPRRVVRMAEFSMN